MDEDAGPQLLGVRNSREVAGQGSARLHSRARTRRNCFMTYAAAPAGGHHHAKWVIAEGADAAAMSRSVPLRKCMDDAVIALYQNGEAIRPEQGYPMRLLLPGFEGNMNVKWLRRLKVTNVPLDARDETSHYTELMPNGKARQYMFLHAVKSILVKPSFGMTMKGPGLYEVSGLAWSGAGRISKVEVSADGGRTWTP